MPATHQVQGQPELREILLTTKSRPGEIQSVKHLPCKPKNQSPIPRTHTVMHTCNTRAGRQTGGSLGLASQLSLPGERQANKTLTQTKARRRLATSQ